MKAFNSRLTIGLVSVLAGLLIGGTCSADGTSPEFSTAAEPAVAEAEGAVNQTAEGPARKTGGPEPIASAEGVPTPVVSPQSEPASPPAGGSQPTNGVQDVVALERNERGAESGIQISSNSLINVTVENETLENVVAMFTRISGANIVATSANLDGLVTVNLQGVEWKPALSAILELHDLALVEKMPGSGVYSIVPKPPEKAEPLVVDTLFLSYTTVAEVKPVVATMLASVTNATITEFPSRNAMVIRTTEANLREIKRLIESMDQPGKQVCVEAKFMELTDQASKVLGINWQFLGDNSAGGGTPGVVLGVNKATLSYEDYLRGSKLDYDGRLGVQEKRWQRNRELADGATIPGSDLGFAGDAQNDLQVYSRGRNLKKLERKENEIIVEPVIPYEREVLRQAILSVGQLNAVLNALKKTEGISIISNPKIIVASGSTNAYFKVGDREPIVRTELIRATVQGQADTQVASLDTGISTEFIKGGYLETGISLQVIPVVKTDSMIEAIIQPRLTRMTGEKSVTVGESVVNSWPRISVKEITTRFTLLSGQTVAIGGLTDTTDTKNVSKIPLLGDIPLIGKYLFSHTKDSKKQVETIVLVTLTLAQPENLQPEMGIPDDATLVHTKIIRSKAEKREFQKNLEKIKAASEAGEPIDVKTETP